MNEDQLLHHPDLLSLSGNFWSEQIQETRQRLSVTRQKAAVLMENMRVLRDQMRTLVGVQIPVQSQVRLDVHSDDRRHHLTDGLGQVEVTDRDGVPLDFTIHVPRPRRAVRRPGSCTRSPARGTWSRR